MTRAIIWKELREQGLIGLALVVLGSGVLIAAAVLADPPAASASPADVIRFLGAGRLAALMLTVTAGMVCGGAVFAAEREAGTMGFLESLPATRGQLWRAKLAAGVGLAIVQVGMLIAVAAALGLIPTAGWALAFAVYALLAFVWGLFGSTIAWTTLGSVGVAIPAASATAVLAMVPVVIFFQSPGSNLPRPAGGVVFLACMFGVPLALSAWLFTSPDRARAADDATPTPASAVPHDRPQLAAAGGMTRVRAGVAALAWLSSRQLALVGPVLSGFAIFFGICLLAPGVHPFLVWPGLALSAGVLAGVTAFADEQTRGAARFWGEQRLPLGRTWAVKIGLHFGLLIWLLFLLAFPSIARTQLEEANQFVRGHSALSAVFRSPLFDELGWQGWKYLLVPAVYGFAVGHLCGLLFRKLVVACGVAGIVGGVSAAGWGPSLLAGGIRHWQLWLPPVVALLTARLLMRAWAADRLATRGPLTTLAAGCAATAVAMAAGLAYRVLEIPDLPGGEADIAYVAGLPPFDENKSGRDMKTAAEHFSRAAAAITPAPDQAAPAAGSRRLRVEDRLERVSRDGWPADDPQLAAWLDKMFSKKPFEGDEEAWHVLVGSAATLPIGVFEYPQMIGAGGAAAPLENARRMAFALIARGLQRQSEGFPAEFPEFLRVTMALARTVRNGSVVMGFQAGADIERTALAGLDRWLDRLPGRANLAGAAADTLTATDSAGPFDPTPYFLAERHVVREAMKAPAQWLPGQIAPAGATPDANAPEADLVGVAWAVPWERERTRRLVGLGFESGPPADPSVVRGRPGVLLLAGRSRSPADMVESDRNLRTVRRAAILKLAIRAFHADRGKYPESLADLAASGYLRAVPADPYDDARAFGYRISAGETLRPPPQSAGDRPARPGEPLPAERFVPAGQAIIWSVLGPRAEPFGGGTFVPAGQAIIWSVGMDKLDQGGVSFPAGSQSGTPRPPDIVFLVPTGPNP